MRRREITFFIRSIIIAIFVLFVLGYGLYKAQNLMSGPQIIITSPENGDTVNKSLVEIIGETKNINEITMNDGKIFIDEKGEFKEKLLLFYGYNIIEFEAKDKFGRTVTKKLELIYK